MGNLISISVPFGWELGRYIYAVISGGYGMTKKRPYWIECGMKQGVVRQCVAWLDVVAQA